MTQVFANELQEADSWPDNTLLKEAVWRQEPLFFSEILQFTLPKIELFHRLIDQAFLPVSRLDRMPQRYPSSHPS
jgi:hypothetical protein